jgi:UDP-glucose 4-epimerase
MNTRCLVIGGAGFIGSWLVAQLIASGRQVTVLGRSASPARSLPATVRYIAGDFNNPKLLQSLLAEHEEVIDLAYATVPNTSFSAPLHDLMQNLPVAVALFEAACAAQVRKVIIVSSGGTVYGEAQSLPISESHPTHPISPYGITKLTIDHYAQWFHAIHGLPVVCLRPGNAYGEGQLAFRGQGFVATAIASVIEERPIQLYGEEGAIRDYVHAEDIAAAIVLALEQATPGEIYNIGSGSGLSNLDVIAGINRLAAPLGKSAIVQWIEARPFDVRTNILDAGKFRQQTGWAPNITFEAGLSRSWQAGLREHGF